MKNRKILKIILLVVFFFSFSFSVFAQPWATGYEPVDYTNPTANPTAIPLTNQSPTNNLDSSYQPLAPLPGLEDFNAGEECAFGKYLNTLIKLIIAILGVLAVVMIVWGGMQYMTSELISSKEAGKERIINAFLGLIIALSSYLIFNTINPDLLNLCLRIDTVDVVIISTEDTSTGSSTSLCVSDNSPNPNNATGTNISLNATMINNYIPTINSLGLSKGARLLLIAQTHIEGFYPGTKSYRTNNPGNIGNTDDGSTREFTTLKQGIAAQRDMIKRVANGTSKSYKMGGKYTCALGGENYNGSLYQYLRIYSTGARSSNAYLNAIIGYFAQNGLTITPTTTISQIYNMN